MKKVIVLLFVILINHGSYGQCGEFEIQENGLIYGESTMKSLKAIVKVLNLKFKQCDVDKDFDSKYQTLGHYVVLKKGAIKEAKKDIERNIGFEAFIQKYPHAEVSKNNLVVRFAYKDYFKNDVVAFSEISLGETYGKEIRFEKKLEQYTPQNLSNWVYQYAKKTSYSEESITAFYFPNRFESRTLPKAYAHKISYADCMIDTTTTKFKDDLKSDKVKMPEDWRTLPKAQQEALLDKLRSTRVVGHCSMDSAPRKHAVNIAMLSAETHNWKVFLRAHLDVMNDAFDRMSDGSYAWGERQTYIKELEELDINVLDLIIGIALRVENPANNHYYGDVNRLGRALAESGNRAEVEHQLFSMLEDKELDLFNRIIGLYIIENYIYNLTDKNAQQKLESALKESVKTLPQGLYEKIKIELVHS
ncbi:MAG: hypothetical protein CR968_03800 [Flavobacteriia bacterium]|nr:MAG: hypothetical protein CR968_03800 [Flavobacteriia bacterium]